MSISDELDNNLLKVIKDSISNISSDRDRIEMRLDLQRLFCEFTSSLFQNNFLFVYGTLRKGQSQYKEIKSLFGDSGIEYICTNRYDYKQIVDLGQYPALLDSKTPDYVVGDIIYTSNEVSDYIKARVEAKGFIMDSSTLWIPSGSIDSKTVKILSLPTYVAGDNLIKEITKNRQNYPKIEVCDWIRYQKQTKAIITDEEKALQLQIWAEYCGYCD